YRQPRSSPVVSPAYERGVMNRFIRRKRSVLMLALPFATAVFVLAPAAASAQGSRDTLHTKRSYYDIRNGPLSRAVLGQRAAPLTHAAAALKRSLGVEGVVAIDPVTSTVRIVARTNG